MRSGGRTSGGVHASTRMTSVSVSKRMNELNDRTARSASPAPCLPNRGNSIGTPDGVTMVEETLVCDLAVLVRVVPAGRWIANGAVRTP